MMLFRKTPLGLQPENDEARKSHAEIRNGTVVGCKITRGRKPERLAFYWAILETAADNWPGDHMPASMLHILCKMHVGLGLFVQTPKGQMFVPDSIAFSKMTEDEFREYLPKALGYMAGELGVTVEELVAYTGEAA